MVDLKILEKRGITPEKLKEKLQGDPLGVDPMKGIPSEMTEREKIMGLLNRIRSRIQEGMARNFADFRVYHALDQAWDTPFRQISPTLLQTLMDSNPNEDQVYKAFQDWGLTSLITEEPDPKDHTKKVRQLNLPVFFNVFVPLVKAYVTIRWAKIMNDRRLTPFFKYEPVKMNAELQLKCDVLTDRVEVMSQQYGYYDVTKQAVLKMLHYSTCLQFVREAWHFEEQVRYADADDVLLGKKKADGTPASEGDEITVTDREGLRYHLPHPSRSYYDLAHGAYTLNYDSGCEFCGYWAIRRYRDILAGNFWNKDKIALGTSDIISGNRLFFTSVYSACTMTSMPCAIQPKTPTAAAGAAEFGTGAGTLDREKELAVLYYGNDYGDKGVLVTEHFEKLIPKDNGLGDYDGPVWFRFLVAGDGCTVLYAEPLPFPPAIYYGYDADESRSKNPSMSLEILPFQDQFSNVLTQIILTAKQNLANMVLIDEDQIKADSLTKLKNIGEQLFRKLNIFGYSGKSAAKFQNRVAEAAQSFGFPKGNVAELINVLKTILDVLERVLVMSSQEVGQAASHEQTREEIRNITQNTSSRQVFSSTPVDIARDAWKRQIYYGLMANGDDDFPANIPSDIPLTKEVLEKMGFTFKDKDVKVDPKSRYVRAKATKKVTAVPLWELASTRDGEDRTNNEKIALTLATLWDKVLGNPVTAQAVGPDQAIEWANRISYYAGIPRDFKLRNVGAGPEQQQEEAQAQLKEVVQAVLQAVHQTLPKELEPLLQQVGANSNQIAAIAQYLKIPLPTSPANDSVQPEVPSGQPA